MEMYELEVETERLRARGHVPIDMDNSLQAEQEHRQALREEAEAVLGLADHLGWAVVERWIVSQIVRLRGQLEAGTLDLDRQRLYAGELSAYRRVLEHVSQLQQAALNSPTPNEEQAQ